MWLIFKEYLPLQFNYLSSLTDNARYASNGNGYGNGQYSQQYANNGAYNGVQNDRKPRQKPAPKRFYKYTTSTGYNVHMRGLPYQASDQDICDVCISLYNILLTIRFNCLTIIIDLKTYMWIILLYNYILNDVMIVVVTQQFFKPLRPLNIVRHINDEGRSAGEADVDFYTDGEALQAMQRDKESIR